MHVYASSVGFCSLFRRVGLLTLSLFALMACDQQPASAPPHPVSKASAADVTFCHGSVTDILPRIALDKGYFAEQGLNVTLKDLSDGKLAFEGLFRGECNFAVNAAPPIVAYGVPEPANYAILATILSDDDSASIIARRDRGISQPQDLRGKRIAVKKGIIGHFFLDLFLMKHGLEPNAVVQVYMGTDTFQQALEAGEVDGFAMTNKMVNATARSLGDQAVVFSEPGLSIIYGILTTRSDIPLNVKTAPQVLKALVRAEEFAKREPATAMAMVAKPLKLSEQEVDELWKRSAIEVALSNALFVNLEDLHKWMVERGGGAAAGAFPNFLSVVEPTYLSAIKSEAVSVIKR